MKLLNKCAAEPIKKVWWKVVFCVSYYNLKGLLPPTTWNRAGIALQQYGYSFDAGLAAIRYEEEVNK